MGTTTDWRPLFVASAASMLRVKASKKWPGWQDAIQEDAAKAACRQAAADIEGIPDLRARAEAAEQRAEAAEAEAERLRSAIAETLRLADIYAGVAAHNAEAEPETAGEAWRSAGAATVRELRRALGGAA